MTSGPPPERLRALLEAGDSARLRAELQGFHPADVAELLGSLGDEAVVGVLRALGDDAAAVVEHLPSNLQESALRRLGPEQAADVLEEMSSDEAADLLADLPSSEALRLLEGMEPDEAADVRELLAYPPSTAGGLMATEVVAVRADGTVGEAMARVREIGPDAETAFYVYVVDALNRLRGVVSLRDLILTEPGSPLSAITRTGVVAARVDDDQEAVARAFDRYRLLALPVVDPGERLLGVVTVDDVIDVVAEEASEDAYRLAGLVEEVEAFDSPFTRAAKRLPWLLVVLLMQALTARVISAYEQALATLIALAYFFPMLANQAGMMGVQSTAIAVRAIATGDVDRRSYRQFVLREVAVGLFAGVASGLVAFIIGLAWQRELRLGITMGVTLLAVMTFAALLGSGVPLVLTTLRKDPAVASGPFVTSTMDLVTAVVYFSLAVLFLKPLLGG